MMVFLEIMELAVSPLMPLQYSYIPPARVSICHQPPHHSLSARGPNNPVLVDPFSAYGRAAYSTSSLFMVSISCSSATQARLERLQSFSQRRRRFLGIQFSCILHSSCYHSPCLTEDLLTYCRSLPTTNTTCPVVTRRAMSRRAGPLGRALNLSTMNLLVPTLALPTKTP